MIAKLKTRLKREIKQHSVPRLGLHDDSSLMEIHKDGEITGRLDLAKELLEMLSKITEPRKYERINLNPKIEKNVPMRISKYFWLKDMEVTDSVWLTFIEKRRLQDYLNRLKSKSSTLYDSYFDDKQFKVRAEKDGFRMWRSK